MLVIVNPRSGVGRQKRIEQLLATNLNLDMYDYTIQYTEHIHHGTDLAREGAMKGYDIITADHTLRQRKRASAMHEDTDHAGFSHTRAEPE